MKHYSKPKLSVNGKVKKNTLTLSGGNNESGGSGKGKPPGT